MLFDYVNSCPSNRTKVQDTVNNIKYYTCICFNFLWQHTYLTRSMIFCFSSIVFGMVSDRFGRRKPIVIAAGKDHVVYMNEYYLDHEVINQSTN